MLCLLKPYINSDNTVILTDTIILSLRLKSRYTNVLEVRKGYTPPKVTIKNKNPQRSASNIKSGLTPRPTLVNRVYQKPFIQTYHVKPELKLKSGDITGVSTEGNKLTIASKKTGYTVADSAKKDPRKVEMLLGMKRQSARDDSTHAADNKKSILGTKYELPERGLKDLTVDEKLYLAENYMRDNQNRGEMNSHLDSLKRQAGTTQQTKYHRSADGKDGSDGYGLDNGVIYQDREFETRFTPHSREQAVLRHIDVDAIGKTINTANSKIIETDTFDGKTPAKHVVVVPYKGKVLGYGDTYKDNTPDSNDPLELTITFVPNNKDGSATIKTLWLNKRSDKRHAEVSNAKGNPPSKTNNRVPNDTPVHQKFDANDPDGTKTRAKLDADSKIDGNNDVKARILGRIDLAKKHDSVFNSPISNLSPFQKEQRKLAKKAAAKALRKAKKAA